MKEMTKEDYEAAFCIALGKINGLELEPLFRESTLNKKENTQNTEEKVKSNNNKYLRTQDEHK